jgi:hypothetical protein
MDTGGFFATCRSRLLRRASELAVLGVAPISYKIAMIAVGSVGTACALSGR